MALELEGWSAPELGDLDWDRDVDPALLGELNDLAYGFEPEVGMARSLSDPPPELALYQARVDGRPACVLGTIDHGDDLGFYFVATDPQFRGRGLALRLTAAALADAQRRGLRDRPRFSPRRSASRSTSGSASPATFASTCTSAAAGARTRARSPWGPGRDPLERDLAALVGEAAVLAGDAPGYSADESGAAGLRGAADAVVLPGSAAEVDRVVEWCYRHGVAIVPRGGGSGYAGGAVPIDGGVVLSLERLDRVLEFDPGLWRMRVEAGVRTATVRRLARESGLLYPPDPGAAEQSQIGGNIATNAGGPHTFKYGVTGTWVTGIEAVVAPGELIEVGGPIRKDVAGYDLGSLLIGSEGTLGVITAAWLRLTPAPEAALPVLGFYADGEAGCVAIRTCSSTGWSRRRSSSSTPARSPPPRARCRAALPAGAGFAVLCEADGPAAEAQALESRARRGARRRGARGSLVRGAGRGRGAVAVARRRLGRGLRPARRKAQRGRGRAARPTRRGDRRDGRDRPPASSSRRVAGATPATATCTRP